MSAQGVDERMINIHYYYVREANVNPIKKGLVFFK